jgi:hypothetical protein
VLSVPLFKRVVLQSGTASSARPWLMAQREEYGRLLGFCGIDRKDRERVEKLRRVDVEMIVRACWGLGSHLCGLP